MGEEKPYNLATLEVINPIHREAVPALVNVFWTQNLKN